MDQVRLLRISDIYQERGSWKLRCWENEIDGSGSCAGQWPNPECIGPASGPERLTKKEAQRLAWENLLTKLRQEAQIQQSEVIINQTTIADFVENNFVPEHLATKGQAGRSHYQSILKHIFRPEEVDRMFHVKAGKSKTRLRAISGWPYLDNVRLRDAGPEHVERLIAAAVERGYAAQTVIQIRNVVSSIFSLAKKERYFNGDNPARMVMLPEIPQKNPQTLTSSQVKEVLGVMRYPEKEMTLLAMFTSMNVTEICGLQWKHVNLTGANSVTEGISIPPITISVRRRWYRGELGNVTDNRRRDLPIHSLLLPMFLRMSGRGKFTSQDDFVLVSKSGTPINAINVTSRRLRSIGKELQMPWISWPLLRRAEVSMGFDFAI